MNEVSVSYQKDAGTRLNVFERPFYRRWVSDSVEWALARLGHPCCGQGLGRIGLVAAIAYRLLNRAVVFGYKEERVLLSLPITPDQGRKVVPEWDLDDDEEKDPGKKAWLN